MYEVVPVDSFNIIVFSGDISSSFAPRPSEGKTPCVPAAHLCVPHKKCKAASYYDDAVTERTTKFYRELKRGKKKSKKKSVINKTRENNILLCSKSNGSLISYRNIRMRV